METKERNFNIRCSITATIPDVLWEDDDFEEDTWLDEWEAQIKPGLIRAIFAQLRSFPHWDAHIRNRGVSPSDEVEIVIERRFTLPPAKRQ